MAVNPWVTFDNMSLNDQNQSLNVPVFSQNDFVWNANPTYDPNSKGGNMEYRQYSDTYGGWEWVDDGTLKKGSWGWNPETEARLKAGGWDTMNPNNIAWNAGDLTSGYHGGGINSDDPNAKWQDLVKSVTMKNSRSTGLGFSYQYDPNSGALVPVYTGGSDYITNSGSANRKALAAFAGLVGAGFAIPAAAAAMGGAGAGAVGGAAAPTELGLGGAGYTGSTAATGGASALTGAAETASTLSQIAEYANYAGKGLNLAGKVTGNEALSKAGGITSALTGGYTGLENLFSGAGSGNLMELLKGAYGTYGAGSKLYNGLVAGDDPTQARSGRMTPDEQRFYGHGASGQGASAPRNWLDQILGIGAGVNSEIQNRETFTNLNNLFSRREQMRAPFEQKLLESYQNPNSFLQGADYQAAAAIANDANLRKDAGRGGLSNDTGRMILAQQHAMKGLNDYRTGLNNSLSQQQLPYEIFRDAQTRNAARGSGVAGGIGYSGATQGILDLLKGSGVTNPTVIKSILSAFETKNDPYGPPVLPGDGHGDYPGFESDYPTSGGTPSIELWGDGTGGDWGINDPGFTDWNDVGGNIDWNTFDWENAGDLGFFDW